MPLDLFKETSQKPIDLFSEDKPLDLFATEEKQEPRFRGPEPSF